MFDGGNHTVTKDVIGKDTVCRMMKVHSQKLSKVYTNNNVRAPTVTTLYRVGAETTNLFDRQKQKQKIGSFKCTQFNVYWGNMCSSA